MANYPGGWLTLENSSPVPITNSITYAELNPGIIKGIIQKSSEYHEPTGGSWVATPITISAEPGLTAVNSTLFVNENIKANAINMQTKMANLSAKVPPPLKNLLYLYGNPNDQELNYNVTIPLNLGGSSYDLFQISVMENAATSGDEHGKVEVIDFGTGPFTGALNLTLYFSGFFGAINLGLRLESTTNQSSICEFRCIVMPVSK